MWRVPPNWSAHDWFEEAQAIAAAAACQAIYDFDPSRGIPLCSFIHRHILASTLTRYRQEWTYASHCIPAGDPDGRAGLQADRLDGAEIHISLLQALAYLPAPQLSLLNQLFWEDRTEAEIGKVLGISQPAVCKRKQTALHHLRCRLEPVKTE